MPLSPLALEPLLRLGLVPGVGAQRLALLVHHFGSAARALSAPQRELRSIAGIGAELARRIGERAGPAGDLPTRRAMEVLRRADAVALSPDDLSFPEPFRALADAPFLLFAAGRLELLGQPTVAMVGTRAPTEYGCAAASGLSGSLARAGYAIASGMARGIDACAHAAALDAGGGTIGVLGHGIDQCYPPENRALFDRVRREGVLLTEYLPGETPRAGNFPRRNRLIAALSRAVVVVEMGRKSGAQHTVTYALEQGLEVMAVPGPIGSVASEGTNQLIKEGARVVTSVEDVLEELQGVGRERAVPAPPAPQPSAPSLPLLTAEESSLLDLLADGDRHVDELSGGARLEPGRALSVLLGLELQGRIEALPGKRYKRMLNA